MHRIALAALLLTLLMPTIAPAVVGQDTHAVDPTTCTVGNENLTYDRDWALFRYSATIACTSAYPAMWLKLTASTINTKAKPAVAFSDTISCSGCTTLVRDGWRSTMPGGLVNLQVDATIKNEHGVAFKGSHDACFWVGATNATLITRGCTK